MIDRRPRVIVRCGTSADVRAAVDFARDSGLDLAVRGGAHSVPGFGTVDDGVVVDLSPMRTVQVDPQARTARAGGGATWGDFNAATYRVRPGDDRRDHLHHRRRRTDARRRDRLPGPRPRPVVRQPDLRRGRDRGRSAGHRQREGARGPVLGAARRRRQLRRGHRVRVPAAPGQGHLRRPDVLRAATGPATSCASSASSSTTRRSSSAGSRRSRSPRRCRSSPRTGTASRSR